MNNKLETWAHVGVYGICIKNEKVLLIKKSRGPYEGMFDLPGGKIEKGETLEQALRREFIEEVGCEIKDLHFLSMNEYSCKYKTPKEILLNFHHTGTYFIVSLLSDDIKVSADEEDSLGAQFVYIKDLDNVKISPIAKPMILKAINKILVGDNVFPEKNTIEPEEIKKEIEVKIELTPEEFNDLAGGSDNFHLERTFGYFKEDFSNIKDGIFPRIKYVEGAKKEIILTVKRKVKENTRFFEREEMEVKIKEEENCIFTV